MKKILLMFALVLSVLTVSATELFYSDGKSVVITKAEGFSALRIDGTSVVAPKNELYRLNLGKSAFSIVSGRGGKLPVYFLGDMPVVAENTLFWHGEKSVEYMESRYGLKLVEILPTYPLYSFSVQGDSVEVAEKIVKNGDGYAFPDLVRETSLRMVPESAPKDPYFDVQWHLQNRGTVKNYYGDDVAIMKNADTKFIQMLEFLNSNNIEVNTDTKVAIMDTGIVPDHEDLTNIEPGYDALNDKEGGYPDTSVLEGSPYAEYYAASVGHGTTCAGVSAGVGNEIGMSGMCPWCLLYPVRYLEGTTGTAMSGDTMLKVYEKYVADPNITTVNCSFGPDSSYGIIPALPDEIKAHMNFMQNGRNGKGGVIVYASGNDGIDSSYEQLLEHDFVFERNGVEVKNRVVTVNASTAWDTRVEYSNYGFASTVIAPSLSETPIVGIATTAIPGYGDYKKDYTLVFSGTSAAAPVVSGFFGAVFSINPDLTLEEAIEILKKSADKVYPETGLWDDKGFSVKFGYGRVNLEKAARLAAGFPMCDGEKEEVCGNHLDDDCDGFVDEGCAEELAAGKSCEKAEDCLMTSLDVTDVECLQARRYWVFDGGYCAVKTGKTPCPDGTMPFDTTEDRQNYICALECSSLKPCERKGYYCSDDVLGVCLPYCSDNSDCNEGSFCNDEKKCEKIPSPVGGSCAEDEECIGEFTTCNKWSKGGYCTQECFDNDDSVCPDGAKCVTGNRWEGTHCLASCTSDKDCRTSEGYRCHPQMGSKSGVCYRECRNTSDCADEDAVCNEDGYCALEGWEGWPEEPEDDSEAAADENNGENQDEEIVSDSDIEGGEGGEEQADDSKSEDKKKSGGCSVVVM
ncbi:S8 family serine peptidase [bacterium]|nr:S8 family serine peptidase [bacterium]